MLTQAELKAQLNYDSETGIFTRTKNISKHCPQKPGDIAGTVLKDGYINIMVKRKIYKAHHLAWLYIYGYMPKLIDHINSNTYDNSISNLREATVYQNQYNARLRKDNTSGVKGITWSKSSNKWQAQINHEGKKIHVGYFDNLNSAKEAIDKAREYYHGEFAKH